MAQKVKIILVDDLDGSTGDETIRFGLDGASYEIDLSSAHASELRDAIRPYVAKARRATNRVTRGKTPAPARSQETARIRQWAKDNGYNVSDRGRIQADIREAYDRAQG